MKILHCIVGLDIGGAELMLKRLLEINLVDPQHQHIVASLTDIGSIGKQLQAKNVEVYSLGMVSVFNVPIVVWRMVLLLQATKPDIVQTWMYHADLLGGLAAKFAGYRHVIWGVRATDVRVSSRSTRIIRWLCARFSSWLPSVIVCAAEASKRTHIAIGYEPRKMVVVPNGYDFSWLKATMEERSTLREQVFFHQNEVVVGCLGRFHEDKDQQNFVVAAGLLAPHFPQLRFLMVGRNLTWDNSLLSGWINQTGFMERFILLGERKDVPQCLAAMDIFCLHSRTEGFPNALAEAMALGLPCVTTDVGDAAILVANTGVVVSKEDSVALAKGVEDLLALGKDGYSALGVKAKARVAAEFSMARARERFDEIYRKVLREEIS
jgi:glycosyltransferase involved in cell wall biosynthesis